MLLAVALCPLQVPHWWESNRNKLLVSGALGFPILILYLFRRPAALLRTGEEYLSFMILLGGLYAIAGGYEYALTLLMGSIAILMSGSGPLGLDYWRR